MTRQLEHILTTMADVVRHDVSQSEMQDERRVLAALDHAQLCEVRRRLMAVLEEEARRG